MTRDEAFEFLDRAARGIAEMFGSSCETLVHDMGVPTHPILSIYNGHVSGREVGSTLDILGTARELDPEARSSDQVNLYATTPSGQQIKSSTFHLIGEDYNLALGINFDYTSLVYANRILVDLMSAEADLKTALWQGGDSALADLFDECLSAVGKPVDALSKADRLKIVAMMDQKNAFSYRKSVPFAARRLGVREGFIPVLIKPDETLLECLVMNADPENDADCYEFDLKTVEEYRKKMLTTPIKDGKAVLEELIGQRREEAEDDELDWEEEVLGEMEGGYDNCRFSSCWGLENHMTYPLILAKIPVKNSWEIFVPHTAERPNN